MTARSIRRALERKQMKLARKAAQRESLAAAALPTSAEICFESAQESEIIAPSISAARLAANRANAQLSTGPNTGQGKAKSSLNAVKTGLTGRTVLLSTDDAAAYERHLAAFQGEYHPVGLRECELVQSIADTFWRLARIPALEMAIFAKGRLEFADLFEEHDLEAQPLLIDAHTFLVYEKQIRNLQLQEARLVRRREKETAELRTLQNERKAKENETRPSAVTLATGGNGFEFSNLEIDSHPQLARMAIVSQSETI